MVLIKLSLQAFVVAVMLGAQAAMASPVPAPVSGRSVQFRVPHVSCRGTLNTVDGARELARCKAKLRVQERMRKLGVNVDQKAPDCFEIRVQEPNYLQASNEYYPYPGY